MNKILLAISAERLNLYIDRHDPELSKHINRDDADTNLAAGFRPEPISRRERWKQVCWLTIWQKKKKFNSKNVL